MSQSKTYEQFLENQLRNSKIQTIQVYLKFLYSLVYSRLAGKRKILEIGSGAGISSEFLKGLQVMRTDLLAWKGNDVIGGIDAMNLPYEDDAFDGIFAVDALHHIPFPAKALTEMIRVCAPDNQIILIEPYVSILSFPIYRLFHTEKTSWKTLNFDFDHPMVGDEPNEGDQCIAQSIFLNPEKCDGLRILASKEITIEIKYLSPLAFFATGGLTKPIKGLSILISALIKFEKRVPQFLLKQTGSRIFVVIGVESPKIV